MSKSAQERRVEKMRKFYVDHPDVQERGNEIRAGKVVAVDDTGLLSVAWNDAAKPGTHTEDELITPRAIKQKRRELPGVVDAFADVRGFLGADADDDSDDRGARPRDAE